MSALLKRYQESEKARVKEARQIPTLTTDYFDITKKYQTGFTTFEQKGEPTNFTPTALKQYDVERTEIVIPTNFVPTELGIDLSRWTPETPYYTAGQGQ